MHISIPTIIICLCLLISFTSAQYDLSAFQVITAAATSKSSTYLTNITITPTTDESLLNTKQSLYIDFSLVQNLTSTDGFFNITRL